MASAAPRLTAAPQTFNNFYKTRMCERNGGAPCAWGLSCNFAHSAEELRPSFDLTRTKMCPRQTAAGGCTTSGCRFAHSSSELRSTETFYKTQLCIDFHASGRCGNGSNCRHAHGEQELRAGPLPLFTIRDPSRFAEVRRRKLRASKKQRRQRQQEAIKEADDKQQHNSPILQNLPPTGSPKSAEASTRLAESPLDQWTTASDSKKSGVILSACGLSPPPGFSISRQQHKEKLAEILQRSPSPFSSAFAAHELSCASSARGLEPEIPQSPLDCWLLGSDPQELDHLRRVCIASKKMQERNDYCKAVLALSDRIQKGLKKRETAQAEATAAATGAAAAGAAPAAATAAAAAEEDTGRSRCVADPLHTGSPTFRIREALKELGRSRTTAQKSSNFLRGIACKAEEASLKNSVMVVKSCLYTPTRQPDT
ncbi:hypothetical protein ACSSS7_001748 [Eimeria intestinalis]